MSDPKDDYVGEGGDGTDATLPETAPPSDEPRGDDTDMEDIA